MMTLRTIIDQSHVAVLFTNDALYALTMVLLSSWLALLLSRART